MRNIRANENKTVVKLLNINDKGMKILNILIVAFAFGLFACAIIGSFDAKATKYAIGIGVGLVQFIVLGLLIYRVIVVHYQNKWSKKEIIWQGILFGLWFFGFIWWMWATAATTQAYEQIVLFYDLNKAKNPNYSLIVMTGVPFELFKSLVLSLWFIVIKIAMLLFASTFYNMMFNSKMIAENAKKANKMADPNHK